MRFALALHTDDGLKYGVTVPDLPGCFSAGDSFDEAVEMAREAIDAHCELLTEKGLDIPSPRPLAEHQGRSNACDSLTWQKAHAIWRRSSGCFRRRSDPWQRSPANARGGEKPNMQAARPKGAGSDAAW